MLSASWLKPYISDNAKVLFEIRFNRERFFSKRMMKYFSTDMERGEALVNEVKAAQKDTCWLTVTGNKAREDWLVLPDGRMVLWKYSGDAPILKWSSQNFASWKCTPGGSRCAGAVVSPDGKLLPN